MFVEDLLVSLWEKHMNKYAHWIICRLHASSITTFDQIFEWTYVWTTSIFRRRRKSARLVVAFKSIDADTPIILTDDLSSDQKYLYEISQSVNKAYLKRVQTSSRI